MRYLLAVIAALTLAISTVAQSGLAPTLTKIKLINSNREEVGEATVSKAPNGVLIVVDLKANPPGISPGAHAIHIHEVDQCAAPCDPAGAHFNPTSKKHGWLDPQGKHVGDLPNVRVRKNAPLLWSF